MIEIESLGPTERPYAFVLRQRARADRTTFPTPADLPLQLGLIVYPRGGQVVPHYHREVHRHLTATCEALVVRRGACELDIYDDAQRPVCTSRLDVGDVVLLVHGGHGIRMLEDTELLEIKQGPYLGVDEKVRF